MTIKNDMLDNLDIELLNRIQQNNLATAEVLAKTIALSPSAIARRLRRLRDCGFIAADIAILSSQLTRSRLYAYVSIELDNHTPEKGVVSLINRFKTLSEVQLCTEISGSVDLMILVCTRDMEAYNRFADRELARSGAVRRYQTHFIKKWNKNSQKIELGSEDIIN